MRPVQSLTERIESEIDYISGERRSSARYALQLPLDYKVLSAKRETGGSGTTRNLSSSGVAFVVPEALQPGARVELAIQWPIALNGSVPLKLVLEGSVTWNEGGLAAIRISRREFRTQRKAKGAGGFPLSY